MTTLDRNYVRSLPAPLCDEQFALFKHGIFDDPAVDVYVNGARDFAVLWPPPTVNYDTYQPRVQKLGLGAYKSSRGVLESRFAKIASHFNGANSILEIGGADGSFLARVRESNPTAAIASVEPDQSTRSQRDAIAGLEQFDGIADAAQAGLRAEVVCLFHVFEHLAQPADFLAAVRTVLAPRGRVIIEIPSLDDPLLSLYGSAAYRDFYFQKQHPFVYSASSLRRVLEAQGWAVTIQPYQRYGMENHLNWLTAGTPGGNAAYRAVFANTERSYLDSIESSGKTDTVFAIAEVRS